MGGSAAQACGGKRATATGEAQCLFQGQALNHVGVDEAGVEGIARPCGVHNVCLESRAVDDLTVAQRYRPARAASGEFHVVGEDGLLGPRKRFVEFDALPYLDAAVGSAVTA